MEEATSVYQAQLTLHAELYLASRGLTDEAVAGSRLGVVEDPMPGHERYRGRLAIPYLSADGHPVDIRFRCLEDHKCVGHGKYETRADHPARVYNVGAITQADDVIHVAEGELDTIILNQIGLPAIGLPGAANWSGKHRRLLAGFSRVWVWGDPDEAGAGLVNKVCQSLHSAKGVRLADGDVNESLLLHGADHLRSLVEED